MRRSCEARSVAYRHWCNSHARRWRNIWQNIGFALGLKAFFLITTLLGITDLWVAVLTDTGATALVTLNALRLLRFRPRQ